MSPPDRSRPLEQDADFAKLVEALQELAHMRRTPVRPENRADGKTAGQRPVNPRSARK